MKRRILLVDDDVAVLLTFKAVLEISGFQVDTAASAKEGKARIRSHEYHMVISDMRMESDIAGREVIQAARTAPYHPAVALLTAFPEDEGEWDGAGPDKILVKATHTRVLLQHIEKLFSSHAAKLTRLAAQASGSIPAKTNGHAEVLAPPPAKAAVAKPPKLADDRAPLSLAASAGSKPPEKASAATRPAGTKATAVTTAATAASKAASAAKAAAGTKPASRVRGRNGAA